VEGGKIVRTSKIVDHEQDTLHLWLYCFYSSLQ